MIIIFVAFLVVILLIDFMPSKRRAFINQTLTDLRAYQQVATSAEQYGVRENIRFFRAAKHITTFLLWQLVYARTINANELLEIADLPLKKQEKRLYKDLRRVERRRFPGLLRPLVITLANLKAHVFLDVGCGAMEVERQLIHALRKRGDKTPRVFIGLDLSSSAYEMIQDTFRHDLDEVSIHKISSLSKDAIAKYAKGHAKHQILFLEANAMSVADEKNHPVDVVYSSKFKHHLHHSQQKAFDDSILMLADVALEFDDYRTAASWVPITLTAWRHPILLNGGLLSRLRQPAKSNLKKDTKANILFFSPPGSYVKQLKP